MFYWACHTKSEYIRSQTIAIRLILLKLVHGIGLLFCQNLASGISILAAIKVQSLCPFQKFKFEKLARYIRSQLNPACYKCVGVKTYFLQLQLPFINTKCSYNFLADGFKDSKDLLRLAVRCTHFGLNVGCTRKSLLWVSCS